MSFRHLRAGLLGCGAALVPFGQSAAHEIVGNRFFPATLTIDDPGVNDELALPTVDSFNTGDGSATYPPSTAEKPASAATRCRSRCAPAVQVPIT